MLTQAMLGFLPDAPHNKLYVDPFLPTWLPDLTVHDLRIGKHMLDIRFWREGQQTVFDVIKGDPKLVERRDVVSKDARLSTTSEFVQTAQASAEHSDQSKRRATRRAPTQSG
jgi:hypothetical protein